MRVLVESRPAQSPSGIGRFTRMLADALCPGTEEHQVWRLGPAPSSDVDLLASNPIEEEFELPALLARESIDIFHSPLFALPALVPCLSVITVHDAVPWARPDLTNPGFAQLWSERAADGAERADAIVCPSEHAKADIMRALGVPAAKIHVIQESPAPIFRALSADERATGRERLSLPTRYLLVVGSLERRKNPLVVLDAIATLGSAHADLHVIYAGPPAGIDVSAEAARRGLADRVRILGHVPDEDLVLLYNEALALVFPSLYEGFGLPIIEAFACATPVLASSAASIPEVAGGAALFFPPEDATALVHAIQAVVESEGLRADLRTRGTAQLTRFARETIREQFMRLYSALERNAAASYASIAGRGALA